MITVAVTGSVPTRDQHPGLPHTPAEIADATYDCYRAGAAIVHIHVRDPETGVATYRLELFRECVERIREKYDILINLTTSGNNIPRKNVIEERLEPVELGTELCSLDIGSLNLGYRPAVFQNPSDWSLAAAQRMRERGVKPEIEVFDMGHAWQARAMIEQGLFDDPPALSMGARFAACVGLAATSINVVVAVLLGGTSGFIGGRFDLAVQRFVDAWMAFPGLLLLLTVMSIVGRGTPQMIVTLGIAGGIVGSRRVRGTVIVVQENDYFQAAESIGSSKWRTVIQHVLARRASLDGPVAATGATGYIGSHVVKNLVPSRLR